MAVTLSLWSREARLNTSYSNTKSGCDVHTNELIIVAFITGFLLSFILQKKLPVCGIPAFMCTSCTLPTFLLIFAQPNVSLWNSTPVSYMSHILSLYIVHSWCVSLRRSCVKKGLIRANHPILITGEDAL